MIHLEAEQTENGEARDIPFGKVPELAAMMGNQFKNRASDYVFTRPDVRKRGTFCKLGTFRKSWNRAVIKIGLGCMCWECPVWHQLIEVEKEPWPPEYAPKDVPNCVCGHACR